MLQNLLDSHAANFSGLVTPIAGANKGDMRICKRNLDLKGPVMKNLWQGAGLNIRRGYLEGYCAILQGQGRTFMRTSFVYVIVKVI